MEIISTNEAPKAIGPYSQAIKVGNLIFTSGQIAIDPKTNTIMTTTIEEQTNQVCKNIKAILEASGSGLDKVVKTVCFLANMEDFSIFNEIYSKYFVSLPARSCVAVKTLPKNVLVEVDTIAELN